MKKIFKLLPALAGLIAMASCSSDDYLGEKGKDVDLSNKIVLKVANGDELATRSYKAYNASTVYEKDDIMRVYDSDVVKYDEFVATDVNGDLYFIIPDEAVAKGAPFVDVREQDNLYDYTYALFGAGDEKNISYAGWKDGAQVALLKIQNEFNYAEKTGADGVVTYKSILPMFGNVTPTVGERQTENKSFDVTMFSLVGRARIVFENGNGLGAQAVRVRAMKVQEGQEEAFAELTLSEGGYEELIEEDDENNLTGWFEAVLDKNIATSTDGGLRPLTETVLDNGDATNEIVANVNAADMENYTSVFWFPIVPGDYKLILFEYKDESGDWHYIHHVKDMTVTRTTTILPAALTENIEITPEDPLIPGKDITVGNKISRGLQTIVEKYAALKKPITITINQPSTSGETRSLVVGGDKANYTDFVVPELAEDMTLVIKGKISTNEGATAGAATLNISGGNGKKLTIILEASQEVKPNIVITAKSDIALKGETFAAGVTVNTTGAVELNGKFKDAITLTKVGDLTLGGEFAEAVSTPEDMAGDIVVSGTFKKGATLETTGDITINGVTTGNAALTTTTDAKTVLTAEGKVQSMNWVHNGGELVIDGAHFMGGNLTVNSGSVTVNNWVNTLIIEKDVESVVVNGTVYYSIKVDKDAEVDIETYGAAVIGSVEGEGKYTIDAHWTEATTAAYDALEEAKARENVLMTGNPANVYTALQLAALQKVAGLPVVLCADITIDDEEATWTPLTLDFPQSTDDGAAYTFDGNGKTIEGLNIESETENVGFFGLVNVPAGVTIKGLTLKNITVAGKNNVGGLIGKVSGESSATGKNKVTIEDCNVSVTKISGIYGLGGLIGALEVAEVTVKPSATSNATLAVTAFEVDKTELVKAANKANAGKVGMFVGTVADAAAKFNVSKVGTGTTAKSFTVSSNIIDWDKTDALGFSNQQTEESGRLFSFSGSTGNEIGYSPNYTTYGNVEINGTKFFKDSHQETQGSGSNAVSPTKDNTINWYGNDVVI